MKRSKSVAYTKLLWPQWLGRRHLLMKRSKSVKVPPPTHLVRARARARARARVRARAGV